MKKVFDFYADTNKKNKEAFFDALPIGNGHIGAMVYGNPLEEKLILNENTFWLGNKDRIRYPKDFYKNYKEVQRLLLEDKYEEAEQLTRVGLFPNPKGEAIYT
ncbi:MAG: glycoside hydrolase family 95 protein, partial [Anaeroplasmataceae bacterium]|nr:glycoside hydrolase family 95 protein [Anaeroplasmataceae bacterium]